VPTPVPRLPYLVLLARHAPTASWPPPSPGHRPLVPSRPSTHASARPPAHTAAGRCPRSATDVVVAWATDVILARSPPRVAASGCLLSGRLLGPPPQVNTGAHPLSTAWATLGSLLLPDTSTLSPQSRRPGTWVPYCTVFLYFSG
jgi:hypothetical protein